MSENPEGGGGGVLLLDVDNVSPLVEIGLTDLPKTCLRVPESASIEIPHSNPFWTCIIVKMMAKNFSS